MQEIELREFQRDDNVEYSTWFVDTYIDKYLGPAWTDEELSVIFKEEAGSVLSILMADELVAVVSVPTPFEEHNYFVITGLAVKPDTPSVLVMAAGHIELLKRCYVYNTAPDQQWVTFVKPSNDESM